MATAITTMWERLWTWSKVGHFVNLSIHLYLLCFLLYDNVTQLPSLLPTDKHYSLCKQMLFVGIFVHPIVEGQKHYETPVEMM